MRIEILNAQGEVENTIEADEAFAEAQFPGAWRIAAPDVPPAPETPEPEWAWLMDLGPFSDRLGPGAAAIDLSTAPGLVAIRSDFARRKWIDLRDLRVIAAVHYLAGQPHPALGTLEHPLITVEVANAALNTLPAPADNLALRKLYFS